MKRTRSAVFVSLIASLGLLSGCPTPAPADGGAEDTGPTTDTSGTDARVPRDAPIPLTVPIFRNPVATPDAELARQALQILGSTDAGATRVLCNDCHDLNRQQINYWRVLTDAALVNCLPDLTLAGGDTAATAVVECLRGVDGRYQPQRLGVFATAGDLDWFRYTFAHGAAGDPTAHDTFLDTAAMPRDYPPLTQEEFDIVAEWFLRGVPGLEDIVPADPLPTVCTPSVSPEMASYVAERAISSWATVNAGAGMLMYGCAGATRPQDCLAGETLSNATPYGATWDDVGTDGVPGASSRVLFTTDYSSSYWTRSSADGRFVGHGAARSAGSLAFIDLEGGGTGPETGRVIAGQANYDPFFFPDGSGFVVQTDADTGHDRTCETSVLTTGMPTSLRFDESGCLGSIGIGLYEHLGTSLAGGDYWAIDSTSVGRVFSASYDPGYSGTFMNPEATFGADAESTVRFLTNSGTGFAATAATHIRHPYQGDTVISPSLGLMVTRQSGTTGQLGYVVHRVAVSGTADARTIAATEVGRYCVNGGKPGISYDERWMAVHHYIENTDADAIELGFTGASDPGFAPYAAQGASNIYLVDLASGTTYRVTNMGPGENALFPHFRSDGWIYFLVRTASSTPEHIVASNAALLAPPL